MKKILFAIILAALLIIPSFTFAAGSCTVLPESYTGGHVYVTYSCTGDSANGSIPTQTFDAATMALIQGTHYLYLVEANPTSGGTAPDAADVQVLINGQDILGGKGVNLIHATATQDVFPYSAFMSSWRYATVDGTISFAVANQATMSANYKVKFKFVR